ncbi:MAG: hypothetical protein FJX76_12520 [Armatimonadetes bacterium]|nr:hypothetical protein [Armatimonadota bacterium]
MRARLVTVNAGDYFGPAGGPFGRAPKPALEVEALGRELHDIDGDVVAMQEVQSREVMDSFLPDAYPHRAFFETNDRGQRNFAILSKHPILETQSNRGHLLSSGPEKHLTRDVGEALIDVGGCPVRFYATHLRADPYYGGKVTPEKKKACEETRMAEARALQEIILADMPGIPGQRYVVMGDLNAAPGKPEIAALTTAESPKLVDTLGGRNDEAVWSHPATRERKDFILVSPSIGLVAADVRRTAEAGVASDHRAHWADVELS